MALSVAKGTTYRPFSPGAVPSGRRSPDAPRDCHGPPGLFYPEKPVAVGSVVGVVSPGRGGRRDGENRHTVGAVPGSRNDHSSG